MQPTTHPPPETSSVKQMLSEVDILELDDQHLEQLQMSNPRTQLDIHQPTRT